MTIWYYQLFKTKKIDIGLSFSTFGLAFMFDEGRADIILLCFLITIGEKK